MPTIIRHAITSNGFIAVITTIYEARVQTYLVREGRTFLEASELFTSELDAVERFDKLVNEVE